MRHHHAPKLQSAHHHRHTNHPQHIPRDTATLRPRARSSDMIKRSKQINFFFSYPTLYHKPTPNKNEIYSIKKIPVRGFFKYTFHMNNPSAQTQSPPHHHVRYERCLDVDNHTHLQPIRMRVLVQILPIHLVWYAGW